jgi:hypothetical protein
MRHQAAMFFNHFIYENEIATLPIQSLETIPLSKIKTLKNHRN